MSEYVVGKIEQLTEAPKPSFLTSSRGGIVKTSPKSQMGKQNQQVLKLKIDIEIPFEDIYRDGTIQTVIKAMTVAMPQLTETVDKIVTQRRDAEQAHAGERARAQ